MFYEDGSLVALGDLVNLSVPGGQATMRVVMLGDTHEHLDIDADFLAWVTQDKVLKTSEVVLEWVDRNPLAHNHSNIAPVGNYMFSQLGASVVRVSR